MSLRSSQHRRSVGASLNGYNNTAGTPVTFDTGYRGHPLAALRDIPAGEYWVQPFVNVYTRFPRADGHTVWMHMKSAPAMARRCRQSVAAER